MMPESKARKTDVDELTFLLTDIEDSTGLVRELGDGYGDVLKDMRALVHAAVEVEGGRVVDCRADEVFAVFPCPVRAVAGARAAQRALVAHRWPGSTPVRVRMGLHTGTATDDGENDFLGLDLHLAARIASAGHGAQVLVSERTAELSGAAARDLGEYELAGIDAPARLFQLLDDGLPARFPPPRSARRCDGGRLRVALADDSVLVREGIARVLDEAGMDVVAQAGTGDDLLREVDAHRPDIAVVDIRMPPSGTDEGLRAGRAIRARFSGVGVLLLSQALEPALAAELLADGAEGAGYLLKDRIADLDQFAHAVRQVAAGGTALDSALVAMLVGDSSALPEEGELLAVERPVGRPAPRVEGRRDALERELADLVAAETLVCLGPAPAFAPA